MTRGTPAQIASFRRRRWIQVLTTAAIPVWLASVLYVDRATEWIPTEQPARGRAILLAFFGATFAIGAIQIATWRCPACGKWMARGAFWSRRCPRCETVFR